MASVYHLHPTPSRPMFNIATSPPSPSRKFASPTTSYLNFLDMAESVSSCGKAAMVGVKGHCPVCIELQQHPAIRAEFQLPARPKATPPPSRLSTPRRSLDNQSAPATTMRKSSVSAVFNRALSSEEEGSNMFPNLTTRTSVSPPRVRTRQRGSMSSTPSEGSMNVQRSRDSVGQIPPLPSPGVGVPRGSINRGYSPMAAGFARLSRKDAVGTPPIAGLPVGGLPLGLDPSTRARAERGSLELEARMFGGPA